METNQRTIVCKLTTPELQKRKATVIARLKGHVQERTEFDDGIAYRFAGSDENLDLISEFIKTERLCCDFFTFQLTVGQDSAVLQLSGPVGAKKFLKEEIDL